MHKVLISKGVRAQGVCASGKLVVEVVTAPGADWCVSDTNTTGTRLCRQCAPAACHDESLVIVLPMVSALLD